MRNGVLEMTLVLQRATWYPEGVQGCGVNVFAFAEEGKTAQTPAPLIRVRAGTALRVVVRNTLPAAIVVRGLLDRPADTAVARKGAAIAAGESRTFEFRATSPGTYLYFATPAANVSGFVPANDYGQAVGALIVDPAENSGRDRIFVFTRWRGPQNSAARAQGYELMAFNGRSWPYTERIKATVGDTVRWRVISANNDGHAMHLHGFHYVIESEGDLARDSIYSRDQQRHVVTELMGPNNTMVLRWVPAREGNWIFHCHLMRHMSASQRLDRMPGATQQAQPAAHTSHAMDEMAGIVLGITVAPAKGVAATQAGSSMRSLRVFANQRERVFGLGERHLRDRTARQYGFRAVADARQRRRGSSTDPSGFASRLRCWRAR
jgi:FtsP/CotA-like multicopper oxidase with cupredoxin domain